MTNYLLYSLMVGIVLAFFSIVLPTSVIPNCVLVNQDLKSKCEQFVTETLEFIRYLPPIFFVAGFFGSYIIITRLVKKDTISKNKDALGSSIQ